MLKKNLDKNTSNKQNNYKVNPSEPKLIQFYVETCQSIAEKNFKDIFWDSFKGKYVNNFFFNFYSLLIIMCHILITYMRYFMYNILCRSFRHSKSSFKRHLCKYI